MPAEYFPLWENASAEVRDRIARQSRVFRLDTSYQIKNFWQTRGLGKPEDFVAESLNESKRTETEVVKQSALGYGDDYVNNMKTLLGKSFSR
jgi:hypothetical protein